VQLGETLTDCLEDYGVNIKKFNEVLNVCVMHLDWVHEVLYSLGRDWINWQEDAYTNHRPVTDLFSSNLTGSRLAWASNKSVREVLRALLMAVIASLCNLLNSLRALTKPVFFLLPSGL
jgi:hypothetical protein